MGRPPILLRVTGLSLTDHNRRHTLGLLPSPLWGGVGGGGSAYGNVAASSACSHLNITKPTRCHRPRRRTIQSSPACAEQRRSCPDRPPAGYWMPASAGMTTAAGAGDRETDRAP